MRLNRVTGFQCIWDNIKVAGEAKGQMVIVAKKLLIG